MPRSHSAAPARARSSVSPAEAPLEGAAARSAAAAASARACSAALRASASSRRVSSSSLRAPSSSPPALVAAARCSAAAARCSASLRRASRLSSFVAASDLARSRSSSSARISSIARCSAACAALFGGDADPLGGVGAPLLGRGVGLGCCFRRSGRLGRRDLGRGLRLGLGPRRGWRWRRGRRLTAGRRPAGLRLRLAAVGRLGAGHLPLLGPLAGGGLGGRRALLLIEEVPVSGSSVGWPVGRRRTVRRGRRLRGRLPRLGGRRLRAGLGGRRVLGVLLLAAAEDAEAAFGHRRRRLRKHEL